MDSNEKVANLLTLACNLDNIDSIDKAIDNVSLRVTNIGAYMNRLESAIESTDVQRESLTQSISTLKDADVATESSNEIVFVYLFILMIYFIKIS